MDTMSVDALGLSHKIIPPNSEDPSSNSDWFDASGNKMSIVGTVEIMVSIPGVSTHRHTFQVLGRNSHSTVLLGRDYMKKFGSVKFDFTSNRVQLGKKWVDGLSIQAKKSVRLDETVTVKARTERIVQVRCKENLAWLTGDFAPRNAQGIKGVYISRARVIPNAKGVFQVSLLNVSETDVVLKSRRVMGEIHPAGNIVCSVDDKTAGARNVEHAPDMSEVVYGSNLTSTQKKRMENLLHRHKNAFVTNPKRPKSVTIAEHRILTPGALPAAGKTRRIPQAWEKEVDEQVKDMCENDIIRPSKSPWNAPILLVKKKDNSTRFVCDFRYLNDVTKKDTYPLPHIRDVLDKMNGAKFWSTLDAASAYWSVPLAERDKEKTAFSVPRGKFEFNVTPYGLCNAGATYQRMMDICLAGLPSDRVLAYMDDIVVFTATLEEHEAALDSVLERLEAAGVTLKPSKCVIASDRVDFLGYELSSAGIRPQKRLTDAIDCFETPKSRKEVRRFVGMAGFYRNFIKDFSHIAAPLHRITSDNVVFNWDDKCDEAFKLLKQALKSEPVLIFPRVGETFVVEVDGSDLAAGGVLSQFGDDKELHPVSYFSNALKPAQRSWAPYTIEAFAILLATRHWYPYLAGTKFVINSDHNPLVHLREQKDPRGKFARWINELEEFDYSISYIPGKDNVKADALSRASAPSREQPTSTYEDKIYSVISKKNEFCRQLKEEQRLCPVIRSAIETIEQGGDIATGRLKRVRKQLRIVDGVLTKSGRPVIPPSLRKYIVTEYHGVSHFAVDKLYSLLKMRFFWPNMYDYISVFVRGCETCGKTKADPNPPKAPLLPMFIPEAPMQFVSMDIAHLPIDEDGFRYVFLMGDVFSKYIEAVPLRDQNALTIVNAFVSEWVLKHGNPLYLLSDQGSNVDGSIVTEVCNALGVEKRRTSAYHSQGNGFAERNIRSIREVLRSILLDRNIVQKQWRKLLPEVVFSLNVTESKSIKCIPYEVVFGRPALLPQDILFGLDDRVHLRDQNTAVQYAEEVKIGLQDTHEHVLHHLGVSKKQMQAQYNKNIRFNDYKCGDKVWVKLKHYKTGENRKLSPRRTGPWTIVEKLPNGVNFKVSNDSTRAQQVFHHDRLSPVKTSEELDPRAVNPGTHGTKKNSIRQPQRPVTESDETDSDSGDDAGPESSTDSDDAEPRYPRRVRIPRQIDGAIPWDAVRI